MEPRRQNSAKLGIDVELKTQFVRTSILEIAFSEAERSLLKDLAGEDLQCEILRRWTIKEAVAKATGIVGLEQVSSVCTAGLPNIRSSETHSSLKIDSTTTSQIVLQVANQHWSSLQHQGRSYSIVELEIANHGIALAIDSEPLEILIETLACGI